MKHDDEMSEMSVYLMAFSIPIILVVKMWKRVAVIMSIIAVSIYIIYSL